MSSAPPAGNQVLEALEGFTAALEPLRQRVLAAVTTMLPPHGSARLDTVAAATQRFSIRVLSVELAAREVRGLLVCE